LAKNVLHNNAYRFSLEWARIEPEKGKFDDKAIEHYKKVFYELKRLKIKSVVTLSHFVHPKWFIDEGGWEKRGNLYYFEKFVWKCCEEFGENIDYWLTINEPNIYTPSAYLQGMWPPQKKSFFSMISVYLNLSRAHKKAYKIIHKKYPRAMVGSAIHMMAYKYFGLIDKPIYYLSKFLFNYSFLSLTKSCNDFVGINYYALHINKLADILYRRFDTEEYRKLVKGRKNDIGRPIYPQGIYEVVKDTWERYKLPILITENGTADAHEPNRIKFLVNHLTWLHQAMKEEADVRGYFYWSLMDNFEWHLGRGPRFGLFETDYETFDRKPRKVAKVYGDISKRNLLPTHLLIK
jgi:beta-glucosidase